MAQTFAIERNLKTLGQLQQEFGLIRTSQADLFFEWQTDLPPLSTHEKAQLDEIQAQYFYQLSQGRLGEETIKLIILSPLLKLAGFYDPPFQFRAEETVQVTVEGEEKTYRGRVDALVLQEKFWVVVIESKETSFSLEIAIPQALTYMLASPQAEKPVFGMVTNGGNFVFLKLIKTPSLQYELSTVFSLLPRPNQLYKVLPILRGFGERIK
ncbi:restriction endonuclease subunit R [Spirulina sp. CS-785/01]|uniref:type I restriction endonuclease n=1 Tax=Spirulina sp. CS-785/01 TaxID=3021716 RepID=UPI00232D68B3|nr:type I restriction endonuclease [Spirulina sp. CS-785/01]MDB9312777.1 restriction endonuclease subunit R [Spirulina sp. CS-785/01]